MIVLARGPFTRSSTVFRRLISFSLFTVTGALYFLALPLLLVLALPADMVRGSSWPTARGLLGLGGYLFAELRALALAGVLWIPGLFLPTGLRSWCHQTHHHMENFYCGSIYRFVEKAMGMSLEVEGLELLDNSPYLVFGRHVSQLDTMVPMRLLGEDRGILLRYVLKWELVWIPCMDVIGRRLPNAYVRRSSDNPEHEVEQVTSLLDDLTPGEATIIFPEGTRFSPDKRAQVIAKLERQARAEVIPAHGTPELGGPTWLLGRARKLRHLMPPRLGGFLGLLEKNPGLDVLFYGHDGFERSGEPLSIFNGSLVHRKIRVRFWRIPYASIPLDRSARIQWMFDQWDIMDDWIQAWIEHPDRDPAVQKRL